MTTGAEMERLAREIAGKLPKRLKAALLHAEPSRMTMDHELLFAHAEQDALHKLGLVTVVFGGAMLTDVGSAVRHILTEEPNDADE